MARYNLSITFPECVPPCLLMLIDIARSLFKSTPIHQRRMLQLQMETGAHSRQSTSMTANNTNSINAGLTLILVQFVVVNNITKITQEFKIPVERLE